MSEWDYETIVRCQMCGRDYRIRVPWPLSAVLALTMWINKWQRKRRECLRPDDYVEEKNP